MISNALDGGDFFNPLFFSFALFLGLAVGWIFFNNLFSLLGVQGKKKYAFVASVIILKLATPYFMFKNSVWLNDSNCPSLTLHGFSEFVPQSAPTGFLDQANSMKQRCDLKNFITKKGFGLTEQRYVEFSRYVEELTEVKKENTPLFVITNLNLSYPFFGKEAPVSAKIEAFTSAIEGINFIFKKQIMKESSDSTLLNPIMNVSNNQITKAFNKAFSEYMKKEFDLIRIAYLGSSEKRTLKVSFDFLKLRYELLNENLGITSGSK